MEPLPVVHRVDWLDSYPFNGKFNDFTGSARGVEPLVFDCDVLLDLDNGITILEYWRLECRSSSVVVLQY
jgi:hypothetical protein